MTEVLKLDAVSPQDEGLVEDRSPLPNPPKDVKFFGEVEPEKGIVRKEVLGRGNKCFLLYNFLTPSECAHYIAEAEKAGFDGLGTYRADYRSNKRLEMDIPDLAELVFKRLKPHLDEIEIIDGDTQCTGPTSFGLEGTWAPLELNERFRICKYDPGDHFAPHQDGCYLRPNTQQRSMKTFMVYLNGSSEFTGGATNFLDDQQSLFRDPDTGQFRGTEENVLYAVKPEAGMAIVFNHHQLHEGQRVTEGIKYIMRSDIIYDRIKGKELSPRDQAAMEQLALAEEYETSGRGMEAVECYRRAVKLSPTLAAAYGL